MDACSKGRSTSPSRRTAQWIVVDYKTDADASGRRDRYEIQLAWYLFALERVKGRPVQGVLLAV